MSDISIKKIAPAIRCEGVRLRYPWQKKSALEDVSFTLMPNTICGLLGRNAAGKTSLMSLLAAYRKPTAGSIEVFGENPYENPNVAPKVAFVYSNNDEYYLGMKVKNVLKHAAALRPNWDGDYALSLIERFKLPMKKSVRSLSLGQRAAFSSAIGLASRTPLTIFDEAYLGMDAVYRRFLADSILADFMAHPRTILFSTHYISEWEGLFSEAAIIDEGRIIAHGDCDELKAMGMLVAGEASAVDRMTAGKELRQSRALGTQKEVFVLGGISPDERAAAESQGLTIERPTLQSLFIALTGQEGEIDELQ
ncbi:MAG: ABC transporter ATP-binding protein [Clostridiales Family XIII bacterium]|jgi:ABC-2 type transport system ATP-binding protein|nr:ABC transporter ATP-binding protein [Clostridiales Family XIII bacterium]